MSKRLYKSNTNKVISGVCGGIGEFFNVDPTIIRLVWVIFSFMGGSGVVAYIIAAVVMPHAPWRNHPHDHHYNGHDGFHGHDGFQSHDGFQDQSQDFGNGQPPRQ